MKSSLEVFLGERERDRSLPFGKGDLELSESEELGSESKIDPYPLVKEISSFWSQKS